MGIEMRSYLRFAALAGLALTLAGCDSVREAAGLTKDAPDEFAIVTKQPLIIPPDFNLHPPKPGAAPANQVSPTEAAQDTLFPDDPNQVASTIKGNYSPAEKLLLAQTGASDAQDSIRQLIAADNKSMEAADDSFTNKVLFGSGNSADKPLDANAEKARLDSMKGTSRSVADVNTLPPQEPASNVATLPDSYSAPANPGAYDPYGTQATTTSDQPEVAGALPPLDGTQASPPARKPARHTKKKKKEDDSGWFDGIF